MGKGKSCLTNSAGYLHGNKGEPSPFSSFKYNELFWGHSHNCKSFKQKASRRKHSRTLCDIKVCKDFLGQKWTNFVQTKNFCLTRDIARKIKIQSTDWVKVFAKHIFDRITFIQNI